MTLKSDTRSAEGGIAELEGALAREMRISTALREVGLALGTTLDLDQLLELILSKITEGLEADRATLYLLDEANNELVSRIVQGAEVRSIRLKVGHGIAGHVAKTGKSLLVKDAYKDPRFNPEWDVSSGYRTRSILAAPMKNHLGRTIGVVQVLNKKRGDFSDVDGVILAALATQAAISEPQFRRCPGLAHFLCAGADRPAALARRVPGFGTPDRRRPRHHVSAHRNARSGGDRWTGPRYRDTQSGHRPD